MTRRILILGCGYTGTRVAARLLETGLEVWATSTDGESLPRLEEAGARAVVVDARDPATLASLADRLRESPGQLRVLHSVPLVRDGESAVDPTPTLLRPLGDLVERVVHLSTTGVYGAVRHVDETTPPAPQTARQRLRLAAEEASAAGPWSTLILRPAAIYGPGRGVHAAMRRGRYRFVGEGTNMVSRIHVDDLAAVVAAGVLADLTGAYPVADEEPAPSGTVARFCADLLGLPLPAPARREEVSETLHADRQVDGRAIRRILGVSLRYPSYRVGIPAALAAEAESS